MHREQSGKYEGAMKSGISAGTVPPGAVCSVAKRRPEAEVFLESLEAAIGRLEYVNGNAQQKLSPIMGCPGPMEEISQNPSETAYFDQLNGLLRRLRVSTEEINSHVERVVF